jgi:hypothetical protein
MDPLLVFARYLFDRALCRARLALDGEPESGALSLEWIVIAVLIVGAATAAGAFFTRAIGHEAKKLP